MLHRDGFGDEFCAIAYANTGDIKNKENAVVGGQGQEGIHLPHLYFIFLVIDLNRSIILHLETRSVTPNKK